MSSVKQLERLCVRIEFCNNNEMLKGERVEVTVLKLTNCLLYSKALTRCSIKSIDDESVEHRPASELLA